MPRKSRQLRLSQAQDLSEKWSQSPLNGDWKHRFINDMVAKLEADRGTSTKQRNWLDSLIEEGLPEIENKNPELAAQIEEAIAGYETVSPSYDWEAGVLRDMLPRVVTGRQMSEKQMALLTRLTFDGSQVASGNVWEPSEDQRRDLSNAVKLCNSYSRQWKLERPGLGRARNEVVEYLAGDGLLKPHAAEKLLHAMRVGLKKLKSPRFKTGDIGKFVALKPLSQSPAVLQANITAETNTVFRVVCMSDARVDDKGNVVNDWLFPNGELKTLPAGDVGKR